MKTKLLFTFALTFFTLTIVSAQLNSCTTRLSTLINNRPIILRSDDAVLTLNTTSCELTLKVNNATLLSETDTFNTLFHTREDMIVFTGTIPTNIVSILNQQSNTGKVYPVSGVLNINGQSVQLIANYSVLKVNNQREENPSRNIKMSLFISFPPSTAKLNKYYPTGLGDFLIQVNEETVNIIEQ